MIQAFEQGGVTASDSAGLGLGLSIAHELTILQGGRLRIQSKLNQGTVCDITFPLIISE